MSSSSPTAQQIAAFNQVLDAFFELFEWCYEVQLAADRRGAVRAAIVRHWSDPDDAVRELMRYVMALHDTVFQQPQSQRQRLRTQARGIFKRLLARPESNGRGLVLRTLHQALETLRPGCTAVALATAVPSGQATPGHGAGLLSSVAAAQPPAATAPAWPTHQVQPTAPTAQPAALPGQLAQQPPVAAQTWPPAHAVASQPVTPGHAVASQPATIAGGGAGQFDPYGAMATLPDTQRIVRQAEVRQQNMMLDQKIWDMQHQMVMKLLS